MTCVVNDRCDRLNAVDICFILGKMTTLSPTMFMKGLTILEHVCDF